MLNNFFTTSGILSQLNRIDTGVIVVYLILMIAVGVVFARFNRTLKDLFAAGGGAPWWLCGISSYMTFFSAGTFVMWGSMAYCFGWVAITIQWVIVIGTMVATFFFAARWKRIGVDSPIEFLEQRYSPGVRLLYVWIRVPFGVFLAAQAVYSISILAHDQIGMGMSLTAIIVLMTFVIILYTVLGGLWAVLTTDLLQFFVLTIITLIALPVVLKAIGGLDEFISKAPQGFFNIVQNPADYAEPERVKFTGNYFLWWTILQIFNICSMWELIQRFQSCPNEKDAKKSGWLVVGLYIVMPIFWLVPLMMYRIIDSGFIDLADPLNTKKAEIVYVAMIQRFLPVGLTGLALAAMFSATGSLVNSSLNVMSSVITKDFYKRLIRKEASDRELVFVGRVVIFLLGLFVILVASQIYKWGGAVKYFFVMIPITLGPLAVPFLWGVITRRAGAMTVWLAVLFGVVVSLVMQFLLPRFGYQSTLAGRLLASTAVPLAVLFIGAFLEKQSKEKYQLVDDLFTKMSNPMDEALKTSICKPAIRLIGVLTMLCGLFLLQLVWFVEQWKGFIAVSSIIVLITGFWFWFNNRERDN